MQECTSASPGLTPHTQMDHSNKATCLLPITKSCGSERLQDTDLPHYSSDKQEKQPEIEQSSAVMTNTRFCTHAGTGVRAAADQGSTDVAALLQTRTCATARITSQTASTAQSSVTRPDVCGQVNHVQGETVRSLRTRWAGEASQPAQHEGSGAGRRSCGGAPHGGGSHRSSRGTARGRPKPPDLCPRAARAPRPAPGPSAAPPAGAAPCAAAAASVRGGHAVSVRGSVRAPPRFLSVPRLSSPSLPTSFRVPVYPRTLPAPPHPSPHPSARPTTAGPFLRGHGRAAAFPLRRGGR